MGKNFKILRVILSRYCLKYLEQAIKKLDESYKKGRQKTIFEMSHDDSSICLRRFKCFE